MPGKAKDYLKNLGDRAFLTPSEAEQFLGLNGGEFRVREQRGDPMPRALSLSRRAFPQETRRAIRRYHIDDLIDFANNTRS